jgi:hypothetical protein
MTPDDLAFVSTPDLINELVRRTTFLGIIVQSTEEYRNNWTQGERTFRVHYNENLDDDEARRLLAIVSDQMMRFDA